MPQKPHFNTLKAATENFEKYGGTIDITFQARNDDGVVVSEHTIEKINMKTFLDTYHQMSAKVTAATNKELENDNKKQKFADDKTKLAEKKAAAAEAAATAAAEAKAKADRAQRDARAAQDSQEAFLAEDEVEEPPPAKRTRTSERAAAAADEAAAAGGGGGGALEKARAFLNGGGK